MKSEYPNVALAIEILIYTTVLKYFARNDNSEVKIAKIEPTNIPA
jgi:hypothetical protein